MAQGYYTLEEAARLLGMDVDELKVQARRGDIRSFQDRGTWRFRVQDIQELARQRGLGSEPDLALGESMNPMPKKPSGLKKGPAPSPAAPAAEVFGFDQADESTGIGQERLGTGSSARRKAGLSGAKSPGPVPRSPAPGRRTPAPGAKSPAPGPKSPTPKRSSKVDRPEPGSDSDVRLVSDDPSMDFGIEVDSDVRLGTTPPPGGPKSSGKMSGPGKSGLGPKAAETGKRRTSEIHVAPPDSGVRLVPMDSDSDVRIVGADAGAAAVPAAGPPMSASDSDIRLEFDEGGPIDPGMLTDEIDLDAELRKQQGKPAGKALKPAPEESPFELSETDFQLPSTGSSLVPAPEPGSESGSSDFDLTPGDGKSPLDSSAEFELPLQGDSGEVALDDAKPGSGISLRKPLDSGISLEQDSEGSDEFEIGLSPDRRHKTPPAKAPLKDDSDSEFELDVSGDDSSGEMSALEESSEFELTMDAKDSSSEASPLAESAAKPDSSEFELTLDVDESSSEFELTIDASNESAAIPDLTSDSEFELQLEDAGLESSSEFELTIDDDLQLVPEEDATPQIQMDDDIVQTDLDDSPLLSDDTGSDVVPLEEDTGFGETSDFDIEVEDDSSSQVVALEEEFDVGAEVGDKGAGMDFEGEGYDQELAGVHGAAVEREQVVVERDVYAAPWSAWPVIVLLPCVLVMFFIGLMGFELVQSMNGYQEPGTVTKAVMGVTGIDKM